jgi:hypothetical protein
LSSPTQRTESQLLDGVWGRDVYIDQRPEDQEPKNAA